MGGFLAASSHNFKPVVFLLAIFTTIFLQVLSNLANDYGDYEHGADNSDRKGPRRAVESGAISADEMKRAIWVLSILSFGTGIYLLYKVFSVLIFWSGRCIRNLLYTSTRSISFTYTACCCLWLLCCRSFKH